MLSAGNGMSVRGLCFAHVSGCELGVCFGECWQDCVKSYQLYGISTTHQFAGEMNMLPGVLRGCPSWMNTRAPRKCAHPKYTYNHTTTVMYFVCYCSSINSWKHFVARQRFEFWGFRAYGGQLQATGSRKHRAHLV